MLFRSVSQSRYQGFSTILSTSSLIYEAPLPYETDPSPTHATLNLHQRNALTYTKKREKEIKAQTVSPVIEEVRDDASSSSSSSSLNDHLPVSGLRSGDGVAYVQYPCHFITTASNKHKIAPIMTKLSQVGLACDFIAASSPQEESLLYTSDLVSILFSVLITSIELSEWKFFLMVNGVNKRFLHIIRTYQEIIPLLLYSRVMGHESTNSTKGSILDTS